MLDLQTQGAVTFDYGNNIRAQAQEAGVEERVRHPRLRAGVHPSAVLRRASGPFRWVALSGDPEDIAAPTELALELFPRERQRWRAGSTWRASGSSSRDCRRASAGSATASAPSSALAINDLVRTGELKAPIVIGRDHLDCGSVASPYRETEAMRDGSDAIADWPLLNALVNTAAGASWVSIHNGGGVGIGYSLHAGMVVVADGTAEADAPAGARADERPRHGRHPPRRRRLRRGDPTSRAEHGIGLPMGTGQ